MDCAAVFESSRIVLSGQEPATWVGIEAVSDVMFRYDAPSRTAAEEYCTNGPACEREVVSGQARVDPVRKQLSLRPPPEAAD